MGVQAWVTQPCGLAVQVGLPALTMAGAIGRGWQPREDGRLLEPKPPAFLQTSPFRAPRSAIEYATWVARGAPWA
jgi:hypothetical protein